MKGWMGDRGDEGMNGQIDDWMKDEWRMHEWMIDKQVNEKLMNGRMDDC